MGCCQQQFMRYCFQYIFISVLLKGWDLGNGPGFDPETCWACGLAIEPNVLISWFGIMLSLKLRPLTNSVDTIVGTHWESGGSFRLMSFTCLCDCCCAVCQYCAVFVWLLLCCMSVLCCVCGFVAVLYVSIVLCLCDCCCAVCQYCAVFVGLYLWLPNFYKITHILKFFFLNIQCKPCQIFTTGGWMNCYLFVYLRGMSFLYISIHVVGNLL
jgi:hypothetical protein